MTAFAPGDVVCLRSDQSVEMTVMHGTDVEVTVVWLDTDRHSQVAGFPVECLLKRGRRQTDA